MKYLQYHLKRNIKNVSLFVIFLTLWNTSYTQTETQYYESFFTNTNLEKILEEQRDSLLKMFNENDKTLINSIQMEIVNSKDIRLIESSYNNNVRKITISNTFLRTLAKISDAFHIEGTIDKSKHTYEYLDFCVENSDTTILGPATFYKLNPNNIQQYVSSQSINGRIALYFLSLRFILLHEYAHHVKGHLENNITNEKSKVDQEIEADNYAMKYFSDLGWPPALISQMMYFFYKLDNSENITDNEFSHPTGLERTSSLISNSLMHLEETCHMMIFIR